MHAKPRVAGVDEDLPFIVDHLSLAAGDSFTFTTDAGDLGDGLRVRVVSLDDLIRMKEAAGRPKDEAHLHVVSDPRAALCEADRPPTA